MKDKLVNFAARLMGVRKILETLDGNKSYVAGGGLVAMGLGLIAADLVPLLADKDAARLIAFASGLPAHPGAQRLLEGLSVLGLRHAISKAAPAAPSQAQP